MMNRNEFFDYVKENVLDYMPDSYQPSDITFKEYPMENDVTKTAIIIRRENETIVPTIYLDGFYEQYLAGREAESCVADVADLRIEHQEPEFNLDLDAIKDYEQAKHNLKVKICDPALNTERLNGLVSTEHGDFAAYYSIVVSENENGGASVPVNEGLFKSWGISVEQLHADALAADRNRGVIFIPIEYATNPFMNGDLGAQNMLDGDVQFEDDLVGMYILSNEQKNEGASLILNEDIRKQIGNVLDGDYFVIPSSRDEVIVLTDDGNYNARDLNELVKCVNEEQVAPNQRLSDKVQYCEKGTGILENAVDREKRLEKEKQAEKSGIRGKLDKAKGEVKNSKNNMMMRVPKAKQAGMAL
jgi:hypothetical protein